MTLTLQQAECVANATLAYASENNVKPLVFFGFKNENAVKPIVFLVLREKTM